MAHKRFLTMAPPDRPTVATRTWAHRVGATVAVNIAGHELPFGTRVTVKTLVPGVQEPGYIVSSAHNGDYWMRESEVRS